MKEWKKLLYIVSIFLGCFYLPIENLRFINAVFEALSLVKWYSCEHVLLCLVPHGVLPYKYSRFYSQGCLFPGSYWAGSGMKGLFLQDL